MPEVNLYNTLSHRKEILQPIHKEWVGLYTCGPTVYNFAHIGNLRTFVFYDLLKRSLELLGYKTRHVLNITDVGHLTGDEDEGEDKMQLEALKEKKTPEEIAAFYTKAFSRDAAALNILPPWKMPKASEHIKEDIALIAELEKRGFTYSTPGILYFDTTKFKNYGALIGEKALEGALVAARADVEKDPNKKNPRDFALWFRLVGKHRNHAMHWNSPWGDGFPGWHIECSAMSEKYLGVPFDIHAGGIDHIPVHHSNEIAQTEAATGKTMANLWMHGEFMTIQGDRMGKSEGNFITLESVIEKGFDPMALRYLFLLTHYRKRLNFSWPALKSAGQAYGKLRDRIDALRESAKKSKKLPRPEAKWQQRITAALSDDLNIPRALANLWKLLGSPEGANVKLEIALSWDKVFGLGFDRPQGQTLEKIPSEVERLVAERETARSAKDWRRADELRKQIEAAGFAIKDTPEGPKVSKR